MSRGSRSIFNKRSVPRIKIQSSVYCGEAIALLERTVKENIGVERRTRWLGQEV